MTQRRCLPASRQALIVLALLTTPGQCHDNVCAPPLVKRGVRLPRLGPGRPRCRPDHVIADTVYSSRGFRAYNRLKHFRGIAIRYDKTATPDEAAVSDQ